MKKTLLLSLAIFSIFLLSSCGKKSETITNNNQNEKDVVSETVLDTLAKDASYVIDRTFYKLSNGQVEVAEAPDSASKTIIKVFSSTPVGDMNGDGLEDFAVVLTKKSGGTGTFYYISFLLTLEGEHFGTNSILLGDRIAPQTIEKSDTAIVVNYAMRYPGDSFDVIPSLGISRYFFTDGREIFEKFKK